mmetsp:Transcript_13036/g.36570  ORF Transcript_13036/g.36570 Transcript_13036/m.36570 type:complete len:334 (-) Transcript_13036:484-1485(-)
MVYLFLCEGAVVRDESGDGGEAKGIGGAVHGPPGCGTGPRGVVRWKRGVLCGRGGGGGGGDVLVAVHEREGEGEVRSDSSLQAGGRGAQDYLPAEPVHVPETHPLAPVPDIDAGGRGSPVQADAPGVHRHVRGAVRSALGEALRVPNCLLRPLPSDKHEHAAEGEAEETNVQQRLHGHGLELCQDGLLQALRPDLRVRRELCPGLHDELELDAGARAGHLLVEILVAEEGGVYTTPESLSTLQHGELDQDSAQVPEEKHEESRHLVHRPIQTREGPPHAAGGLRPRSEACRRVFQEPQGHSPKQTGARGRVQERCGQAESGGLESEGKGARAR